MTLRLEITILKSNWIETHFFREIMLASNILSRYWGLLYEFKDILSL